MLDVGVICIGMIELGKVKLLGDVDLGVVEVVGWLLFNFGGVGLMICVLLLLNVVDVVEW